MRREGREGWGRREREGGRDGERRGGREGGVERGGEGGRDRKRREGRKVERDEASYVRAMGDVNSLWVPPQYCPHWLRQTWECRLQEGKNSAVVLIWRTR